MAKRWIITGERGVGKTTFCRKLAEEAGTSGWDVAGLLSLPRCEGGVKTGIEILDLRAGASRMLASARPDELEGFRFCGWTFSEAALEWGNRVLRHATPCDLLLVDEIGPMELDEGRGMTACLQELQSEAYRLAIAVVRPAYEERFHLSWNGSATIAIASPAQAFELAEAFWEEFKRSTQLSTRPWPRRNEG
jgi:nucleoside-triphosphatase THEP1